MAHWKSQDQMTEIWSYPELIKGSQNWHIVGSLRGAGPLSPQVIIMLLTQEKGQGLLSDFLVLLLQTLGFLIKLSSCLFVACGIVVVRKRGVI